MRELLSCFSSLSGKLIPKMSPVVSGEILGVFVNTLTADVKYPLQDCENLQLPIQMQLFGKRKKFSEFFVPFLESTSNFKHFEKKDDCHKMSFRCYRQWKSSLDHSSRSVVTEHALTVNMWKHPKYLPNFHESAFIMFFIILIEFHL